MTIGLTAGKTWENPLKDVIIDNSGTVNFSGITRGGIGDNSEAIPSEISGILGGKGDLENENILFLKNELSRENSHELIVDCLEWFGQTQKLKSLTQINEKYTDFHYTTAEIRDLCFELGFFDFVLDWDLATFKRVYYVFKGSRKMASSVLAELMEKKKQGTKLSVETVDKKNIEPLGSSSKNNGAFGG